ncbi:hypothetical protein [Amphibacillus jilinensis]|uniref:hypothetical protein n=1 Tax=Amphibacillus jilinensis TaxID=1216008 RepID=UPI0002DB784E|nr:hypothetical protein [Amphibacillus jilinensis]
MNESLTLKILDQFAWLFRLLKADYCSLRLIIAFKIKMDHRRVPTIMQGGKQRADPIMSPFVKSLLLYAFYGLFLIPFLISEDSYLMQMMIVFAIMMFILITSMISDFSFVLLDVRDKVILDTKPLDARTRALAKFTHVIIYMVQLTGAFLLLPFLVSSLVQGPLFSLLFFISVILNATFCMVITALFYMAILKFFDGEKLSNLINMIQIFLTVGLFIGYQLIVQSFGVVDLSITIDWQWWHIFLPPIWFSAVFEMFLLNNYSFVLIIASVLAVMIPLLSISLYFKWMPTFERNLQKLLMTSHTGKPKKHWWSTLIGRIVCRDVQERTIFTFACAMMRQEREFKLKVYPSLAISIILPLFLLFNLFNPDQGFGGGLSYLYGYFVLLMIPNVVYMLKYSSKANGAWIYKVVPIENRSLYYRGTLKAFFVQLCLPLLSVLLIVYVVMIDFSLFLDLFIILVTACLFTVICHKIFNNGTYPFSVSFSFSDSAGAVLVFVAMFVIGIFAFIHFAFTLIPIGLYIYLLVLLIANFFVWKKVL